MIVSYANCELWSFQVLRETSQSSQRNEGIGFHQAINNLNTLQNGHSQRFSEHVNVVIKPNLISKLIDVAF